ncbi:MAG: ABC transporter substrate-binding protein [Nitrososphaeria archaeon]
MSKRALKAISKNLVIGVVVVIVVVAALIAYFAIPPKLTTTTSTTSTTTSTTSTTSTTTGGLPKQITLWKQVYADQYSQQVWEKLYKDFEAKYGITIKATTWEPSDGNNKMVVAYEAGSPDLLPDVSNMIGELATQTYLSRGSAEPLDDIYKWLKDNWGDDLNTELFENLMWTGPDGQKHIYLLPWGASGWYLNIHTDFLEGSGVTLDDLKTFDSLNRSLYKLKDYYKSKGMNVIPLDIQLSPSSLGDAHEDVDLFYTVFSGHEVIENGKITINATEENFNAFVKVFEVFKKWYEDGILPKGALTESDMVNNVNFQNGITAMTFNNVGTMIGAARRAHPDWHFAVVPLPASDKHPSVFTILMPRTIFIPANRPAEYKQAAKLWIKFILNKTNYAAWYGEQGGFEYTDVPIYKSLLNRGQYLSDPVWKGVAESFKPGAKVYLWSRFKSMTFADSYNRALVQISEQKAMIGVLTPVDAAKEYLNALFPLYKKWGW